ncbi:MAG: hypothetical protein ACRDQZ_07105 [Mycobacteriales bacterium]
MRKPVIYSLGIAVALCCLLAALVASGSSAASRDKLIHGIWMAGPGCGRHEWFQHPRAFPYFCDGAAYVEKARWQRWGSDRAKAKATMNEAVLTAHNSVGTAPRLRSPVTIVASQIRFCGHHRAYTRIVIRFHKSHKGVDKLELGSLLPSCSASPGGGSASDAAEFRVRPAGALIACGMYSQAYAPPPQVICEALRTGSEDEEPVEQVAKLHPDGKVLACSQPLTSDNHCGAGNAGEGIPTYSTGKRVNVGPFACKVLTGMVQCTVTASGKGFLISPDEITTVGS